MNRSHRLGYVLEWFLAVYATAGCETGIFFLRPREEIVGTVERIDTSRREIHLRTTEARMVFVKYDADSVVYSRDRKLRIDALRHGDLVLVRAIRKSPHELYADLIRMNDRPK